jgi:energy-converting hydrogenase Eha subunit H
MEAGSSNALKERIILALIGTLVLFGGGEMEKPNTGTFSLPNLEEQPVIRNIIKIKRVK